MESKLIAVILTKVYMTNSHCGMLAKQEVFGLKSKRMFRDGNSTSHACLYRNTLPTQADRL